MGVGTLHAKSMMLVAFCRALCVLASLACCRSAAPRAGAPVGSLQEQSGMSQWHNQSDLDAILEELGPQEESEISQWQNQSDPEAILLQSGWFSNPFRRKKPEESERRRSFFGNLGKQIGSNIGSAYGSAKSFFGRSRRSKRKEKKKEKKSERKTTSIPPSTDYLKKSTASVGRAAKQGATDAWVMAKNLTNKATDWASNQYNKIKQKYHVSEASRNSSHHKNCARISRTKQVLKLMRRIQKLLDPKCKRRPCGAAGPSVYLNISVPTAGEKETLAKNKATDASALVKQEVKSVLKRILKKYHKKLLKKQKSSRRRRKKSGEKPKHGVTQKEKVVIHVNDQAATAQIPESSQVQENKSIGPNKVFQSDAVDVVIADR